MEVRSWCGEYRALCQRGSVGEVDGGEEAAKMEELRSRRKEELQKEIATYREGLRDVKRQVLELDPKVDLAGFDASLAKFRSRMRDEYECLRSSEVVLTREIEACRKRFESGSDSVSAHLPPRHKTVARKRNGESRIAEIDAELVGCGGWDQDEHEAFLRVWSQTQNFGQVARALPHRDDVIEHCEWYARRLGLLEEKRDIARRWRDKKIEDEEAKLEEVAERKEIEKRRADERAARKRLREQEARDANRAAAHAWRALREMEARAKEEEERKIAEVAKAREIELREARRAAAKKKLMSLEPREEQPSSPLPPPPPTKKELVAAKKLRDENAERAIQLAKQRRQAVIEKQRESRRRSEVRKPTTTSFSQSTSSNGREEDSSDMKKKKKIPPQFLKPTASSKSRHLVSSSEEYDEDLSAHSKPVFMGAYDLKYVGRRHVLTGRS